MIEQFTNNIKQAFFNALVKLGYVDGTVVSTPNDIILEVPKDKDHGDYSVNVAMRLAKVARKRPIEIANEIVLCINLTETHLQKIEIAGPGFINLTIDLEYLCGVVNKVLAEQNEFGSSKCGNGQIINLEYVSANPTGYLHIGHGRGAAYGDSLARIMKKAGYSVVREHYVNDAGNQITNMALSIYERYKELFGLDIEMKDDYYHGKEIITIAQMLKDDCGDKYLDNFDLAFFRAYGTEKLLNNLKNDLKSFNVEFDVWFSETSLYQEKAVENTLKFLHDNNFTYEHEGATWLKTSMYTDEKDRVIVKADGNYTYLLPDIAYHANKLSRGYTHLIDVLGADHHGYIDRLKAAVSMVGGNSDLIDVEILQMVRVLENGVEVKMSKRSGKAITLKDLIEEVGADALRYFYVDKSLSTHMDLNLDLMKQKSNENPVFYAQYAHARIKSIFAKYQESNNDVKFVTEFNHLDLAKVKDLCLVLLQYQSVVEEAATKRLVHKMTHYINELAYQLHSFYNEEKVITDNDELTNEKLTVLKAVEIVLKDALSLIGVSAPDKM